MWAGLAITPLQLLELATVIPRVFYQLFLTKTPRGKLCTFTVCWAGADTTPDRPRGAQRANPDQPGCHLPAGMPFSPSSACFLSLIHSSLQALLVWTIGLTYSIIVPIILPFTTLYFGLAYLVYKYRFLFVFCASHSSSSRTGIDVPFTQIGRTRAAVRRGRSPTTAWAWVCSSSRSSCSVRCSSCIPGAHADCARPQPSSS